MITIYSSPTCGSCKLLKDLLTKKGIEFSVCEDVDVILSKNFKDLRIPKLEIDDKVLDFNDAYKWAKAQGDN